MDIQVKPVNHFKFTHSILIGMLAVSFSALAYQTNHPSQLSQKRQQQMEEGQRLLNQYQSNKNSLVGIGDLFSSNVETIIAIQAKGLPITAKNVESIHSLLTSSSKREEKIALLRLLGILYTYDNQSNANHLIVQDLRHHINSNDKGISSAALLTFSRLGYFSDSTEILKHAYDKKILDEIGYLGEIAHLLPFAPTTVQHKLLSTLSTGNNSYANEVLISSFTQVSRLKKLDPSIKKALRLHFEKNQPNFPLGLGEYSVIDSFRYSNWLQSSTMLEIDLTGKTYQELIFKHLNNPDLDPRKIIAFLSATEGKYLIDHLQNTKQKEDLKILYERAQLYSRQLPQNTIMRDLVQQITNNMESPPR
jgi:Tfp pilus assembly protein PilO